MGNDDLLISYYIQISSDFNKKCCYAELIEPEKDVKVK